MENLSYLTPYLPLNFLALSLSLLFKYLSKPFSSPHRNIPKLTAFSLVSCEEQEKIKLISTFDPMARVLSTSPLCKTLLSQSRRGFAAAAEAMRRSTKAEDKVAVAQLLAGNRVVGAEPDSWVPDPVTGYYRPANGVVEVDAAELRAMLLRPKN